MIWGARELRLSGHILQECPTVSRLRIGRHDRVAEILRSALFSRNWRTWSEPTIPTMAGIRRLDLVSAKGTNALVVDTTICTDANGASPEEVFTRRVQYYNQEEIRDWVRNTTGATHLEFSAVAFSWRGDIASQTHNLLRGLKLIGEIKLMEIALMEGNSPILRFFKQASGRGG